MQMKVKKKIITNLSEAGGRWGEAEHSNGNEWVKMENFQIAPGFFFQTGISGKTLQSGSRGGNDEGTLHLCCL